MLIGSCVSIYGFDRMLSIIYNATVDFSTLANLVPGSNDIKNDGPKQMMGHCV